MSGIHHFSELWPRDYVSLRLECLWRHSPAARRCVWELLTGLAVVDPRAATPEQVRDLSYALFDLDGRFPEAEEAAMQGVAQLVGARVREGGGSRGDAQRLAASYFPTEYHDALLRAFAGTEEARSPDAGSGRSDDRLSGSDRLGPTLTTTP